MVLKDEMQKATLTDLRYFGTNERLWLNLHANYEHCQAKICKAEQVAREVLPGAA